MKSRTLISVLFTITVAFFFSCSTPVEKKIPGIWVVKDMEFESEYPLDDAFIESSKASNKSVSYELLKNKTAKVYTGFTTFESEWLYDEDEKAVYVIFPGTYDTTLLGLYQDGKLVNVKDYPDIRITTVFVKDKK